MSKKNIFSGLLTVLILAAIVFAAIYFFYPDIAMKYFGVASNSKAATKNAMATAISDSNLSESDKKALEDILTSEEADKVLEAVSSGAKNVQEALDSDEAKAIKDKLSSSVSKEGLESFMSKAGDTIGSLYERLFK